MICAHTIILFVLPSIALMEDQVRLIKEHGLNALALILDTTSNNPNMWKDIETGINSAVLAMLEILFELYSQFWLNTICIRTNVFCQQLAYIAIDEAHLIGGWRDFCAKYSNLSILQTVIPNVSIITMSATFTSSI